MLSRINPPYFLSTHLSRQGKMACTTRLLANSPRRQRPGQRQRLALSLIHRKEGGGDVPPHIKCTDRRYVSASPQIHGRRSHQYHEHNVQHRPVCEALVMRRARRICCIRASDVVSPFQEFHKEILLGRCACTHAAIPGPCRLDMRPERASAFPP